MLKAHELRRSVAVVCSLTVRTGSNVATTWRGWSIVTWQVASSPHGLLQPEKVTASAVCERFTTSPLAKLWVQSSLPLPQRMPAGVLVIVPFPLTASVSWNWPAGVQASDAAWLTGLTDRVTVPASAPEPH